jgi:hypothetical protein
MRRAGHLLVLLALVSVAACGGGGGDDATAEIRQVPVPAGGGSGQPQLARGADGTVVLSWLETRDTEVSLRFAILEGGAWSPPRTIVQRSDLFVNWADVPSVVPITDAVWIAHWLALVPDSFGAYDVVTSVSGDSGSTWSEPAALNDDATETEHGFATLFPWGDTLGAVWLDGRRLADWSFDRPDELLGTGLRYARLAYDGRVVESAEIDPLVCDCCQTDVAITASGPIVIYRDRSEAEIRDVEVRRHDGRAWLAPVALGSEQWFIEGCPVNGPAIDARADDVAAAWFTAAGDSPRVRFARSGDGGASFSPALDIDTEGAYGQVDVAMLEDSTAVVAWWRRAATGGTALAARTVDSNGALGPIHTIATSAASQPLDVPQMIRAGDGLMFTWTGLADGGTVQSAYVRDLN